MGTYQLNIATPGQPGREQADGWGALTRTRKLLPSVWDDVAGELSRLIGAMGIPIDRIEDVLQDVYLASWQKVPATIERDALRRWLFRVTANRCNLEHRRRQRWRTAWSGMVRIWPVAADATTAEETASRGEERRLIQDALDTLAPILRSVLILRYYSGFNSKEIGDILGLPDSTVRSHLRTARWHLASELRRAGFDDETTHM